MCLVIDPAHLARTEGSDWKCFFKKKHGEAQEQIYCGAIGTITLVFSINASQVHYMDSCIPDAVLWPVSPFRSGLDISLNWPISRVVKVHVVITRSTPNKINQGNNSKTYLEKVYKWPHHEAAFREMKQNDCSVESKRKYWFACGLIFKKFILISTSVASSLLCQIQ